MDNPAPSTRALPERTALLCFVLWIGFAAIAASIYSSALTAPFMSDDFGYIVSHPYTESLDAESLREIFDPWGPAKLYTANYAPVHLLLTAIERQAFGDSTRGYHIVNIALHALVSVLLVAWLWQLGVGRLIAVAAGLVFLVHPANVEAVAWMSQLKTLAAMSFSLASLLLLRRLPALATLLFILAILTKSAALFLIPTAVALACTLGGREGRRTLAWLSGWLLISVAYAFAHIGSFELLPAVDVQAFDDPLVHLYTVVSIGMRYIVMAATSYGVSAWQEPAPVLSPTDPWVLAAVPMGFYLAVRFFRALRAGSSELVFWVAAGAAFLPISQIEPFATPMADRYLYFLLPGLMGAALLEARSYAWRQQIDLARMAPVAAALTFAVVFSFGWRSAERVQLWQSEASLLLDAASHFPEGSTAAFIGARSAAQDGDVPRAIEQIRLAAQRGVDRFMTLPHDPGLAPLRDEPAFQELVRELAGQWIHRAHERGYSTQPGLRILGVAHLQREEYPEAVGAFEAALSAGGPLDETLREEIAAARLHLTTVQAMATQERAPTRGHLINSDRARGPNSARDQGPKPQP
jgi:hypothetical protein